MTSSRAYRPLLPLFLSSGVAGLIYEVVWVRQFGNLFGNTLHSASLVVAVFMLGLGVGSLLAGRWVDRRHAADPLAALRAYARLELAIAGLAVLNIGLIHLLASSSSAISSYTVGDDGWSQLSAGSYVARYGIAILLLAPVTTLMGATLSLLIRYVVAADLAESGYRIGLLYAVNTLGAALGCFLSDFLLIPGIGLLSTQFLAVAANLIAGLGALRLAGQARALPPVAPAPDVASGAPAHPSALPLAFTSAAIAVAGFCAMGMEIVWFRYISSTHGGYRMVFSLVLTTILVGIVVGSSGGGLLERRTRRPAEIFLLTQAAFAVCVVASLFLYDPTPLKVALEPYRAQYLGSAAWVRSLWQFGLQLKPVLFVVAVPAVLMGATFPVANACIQKAEAVVGHRAGLLYLANTFGGVAGSLISGFVLLPALGIQGTVAVLVGVSIAGLPLIYLGFFRDGPARRSLTIAFAVSVLAVVAGLGLWLRAPSDLLVEKSLHGLRMKGNVKLLTVKESSTELLGIAESPPDRFLITNGHAMSSTTAGAQRYMRGFSHIPLLMMEAPKRVLVICFGVGNTLHAASLHPVSELEIVDLSRNVLEHASWFSATNHDVLKDPRVKVFVNDGRQHLRMSPPERFDLITLEPPPISYAGVSGLYSKEFYELARSRLAPGGYLTQWLPAYQVQGDTVLAMVRAFIDVFPQAVLLSGSGRELILLGRAGQDVKFDPVQVAAALAARPGVKEDLERVWLSTPTELAGTFVADATVMEAATKGIAPLTDDLPIAEYSEMSHLIDSRIPDSLFAVERVASWCPGCFANGQAVPPTEDLGDWLAILAQVYRSDGFLTTRVLTPADDSKPWTIELTAHQLELVRGSPYLRKMVPH